MSRENSVLMSLSLLGRVEASDPNAWTQFSQLYGPLVYSWCRNAGLRPEDVDAVGQDVFRVVATKLATFEPGKKANGAFRSWLWGITRLDILQHLRHAQ